MNFNVFTGPDPSDNLNEMLKRIPLGSGRIYAVVPDSFSVKRMELLLAGLSENAFLGHRVMTVEGLALNILSRNGLFPELIKEYTKRALLDEIIKTRIGEKSHYHAIARLPGFLSILTAYLRDIRSLIVKPSDQIPEIASIASAYEFHLKRLGMTDHEGLITSTLENDIIEQFCENIKGSIICDGFYDLTETQFELFSRLFGNVSRSAVTLVHGKTRPALFSLSERLLKRYETIGAKIIPVELNAGTSPDRVLSGFMGGRYPESGSSDDMQIHTFRDDNTEADWICGTVRKLLSDGQCYPGDVMIVSRNKPFFGSPIHSAMRRHGLPVEKGLERPITQYPIIRLILDAVEASVRADEVLISRVQRSWYTAGQPDPVSKQGYSPDDRGWSCMLAETDTPEGFTASLKKILEQLKINDNLRSDRNELSFTDRMIFERFLELLDEFSGIYSHFRRMMKAAELHASLSFFLESVTVFPQPRHGSGIIVTDAVSARHIQRPVVFLTGLDNASFPQTFNTFSLHGFQSARRVRKRRELEEGLLFYHTCIGAGSLYLTFPGIDDEHSDNSMSPYLQDIMSGISRWCKPEFHRGIPGAAWEGGAVNERGRAELMMRILKQNLSASSTIFDRLRKGNEALEPLLRRAVIGWSGRANGGDLTLHEQRSLKALSKAWGNDRVFSVTELERYLVCPAGFFLSRVLGLKAEHIEDDAIGAAEMGTVIHDVLARFYSRRLKENKTASFTRKDLPECRSSMKEIVDTIFSGEFIPGRRFHPIVLISERKLFLKWMESFLEHEAVYFEENSFEPSYFELSFGQSHHTPSTGYPPLSLDVDGTRALIGGRIDRIECKRDPGGNHVRVVDYKSGIGEASIRRIEDGSALQIPLYLKAAAGTIVSNGVPYDGLFYSLRDMKMNGYREKGQPVTGKSWETYINTACRSACTAVSDIRSGRFPRGTSCSDYCEFRLLCKSARLIME